MAALSSAAGLMALMNEDSAELKVSLRCRRVLSLPVSRSRAVDARSGGTGYRKRQLCGHPAAA